MAHPGDRDLVRPVVRERTGELDPDATLAVDPPEHASTDTSVDEYPEGYPHEWAADVLGSDGRAVRVRPILPNDAEKISRFHTSLSERTRYLRYFGSHDVLSDRELARMTNVDYRDRMAFVAELGAEVIGMAGGDGSLAEGYTADAGVDTWLAAQPELVIGSDPGII